MQDIAVGRNIVDVDICYPNDVGGAAAALSHGPAAADAAGVGRRALAVGGQRGRRRRGRQSRWEGWQRGRRGWTRRRGAGVARDWAAGELAVVDVEGAARVVGRVDRAAGAPLIYPGAVIIARGRGWSRRRRWRWQHRRVGTGGAGEERRQQRDVHLRYRQPLPTPRMLARCCGPQKRRFLLGCFLRVPLHQLDAPCQCFRPDFVRKQGGCRAHSARAQLAFAVPLEPRQDRRPLLSCLW